MTARQDKDSLQDGSATMTAKTMRSASLTEGSSAEVLPVPKCQKSLSAVLRAITWHALSRSRALSARDVNSRWRVP
eukprot:867377-Pyramimonas_sp.AAC.1